MKVPADVIESWITQIMANGRGLSRWEEDFMDSISDQFEGRGWITDKQEEILERIYADRT